MDHKWEPLHLSVPIGDWRKCVHCGQSQVYEEKEHAWKPPADRCVSDDPPQRKSPKSKPIWCGALGKRDRQLVIDKIDPLTRGRILVTVAKQGGRVISAIASTVEGIHNGSRCPDCGASWDTPGCGYCDGIGCDECDNAGQFGDCQECGNIE